MPEHQSWQTHQHTQRHTALTHASMHEMHECMRAVGAVQVVVSTFLAPPNEPGAHPPRRPPGGRGAQRRFIRVSRRVRRAKACRNCRWLIASCPFKLLTGAAAGTAGLAGSTVFQGVDGSVSTSMASPCPWQCARSDTNAFTWASGAGAAPPSRFARRRSTQGARHRSSHMATTRVTTHWRRLITR